jgi:RNA polymerase sigma-70 factor (ECF subfamily)
MFATMRKKETYNNMTDSELIAAVKDGNAKAFDALFLRWYPQVLKFIQTLVKNDAVSEDLSQTVFMNVWIYRDRLDASKSLKNYLTVLARNAVLNVFKSQKPYQTKEVETSDLKGVSDQTELNVEYREVNNRIFRAVQAMPMKRRQVFYLSRFMAHSNEEIAEKLGMSIRTVEKHIQLALQDVRKFLS